MESFTAQSPSPLSGAALCQEHFTWFVTATKSLKSDCADIQKYVSEVPRRVEERLLKVLGSVATEAMQRKSVLARHLQDLSSTWRQEIQHRWHRLVLCRVNSGTHDREQYWIILSSSKALDLTRLRADLINEIDVCTSDHFSNLRRGSCPWLQTRCNMLSHHLWPIFRVIAAGSEFRRGNHFCIHEQQTTT